MWPGKAKKGKGGGTKANKRNVILVLSRFFFFPEHPINRYHRLVFVQ
jgi:hypothetical protein